MTLVETIYSIKSKGYPIEHAFQSLLPSISR